MEEIDAKYRCYVLDTLVSHSTKTLTADLIGKITTELLDAAKSIYNNKKEWNEKDEKESN